MVDHSAVTVCMLMAIAALVFAGLALILAVLTAHFFSTDGKHIAQLEDRLSDLESVMGHGAER
jgi:outer membrane lipoprotein-sorting protein